MQTPKRKPGKYTTSQIDPHMTAAKRDELQVELAHLQTVSRPRAIAETKRLGELGDYSENAEYQLAKGKLRGINARITELEQVIRQAVIIQSVGTQSVSVGNTVTVRVDGVERTYTILGSAETDPSQGIISHTSPLGQTLLGHRVGEEISTELGRRSVTIRIIAIS